MNYVRWLPANVVKLRHVLSKQELWLNAQLSGVTVAQILISVAMQWYIVSHFGAGIEADSLYAGSTFSQILTALILDQIRFVLTPLLCEKTGRESTRAAMQFLVLGLAGVGILALILYLALPSLVLIIVPGFSAAGKQLTVELARIQLTGLFGGVLYAVYTPVCIAQHRFLRPGVATLVSGIVCFGLLLWKVNTWSVAGAAWIVSAYVILPGLFLAFSFGRPTRIAWNSSELKVFWVQLRPLIAAKAYFLTSVPLDRLLISFLPPGSITIYELAWRICGAMLRIIDVGTLTPALPGLARLAQSNAWTEFGILTSRKARECFLISFLLLAFGLAGVAGYRFAASAGILPAHLGRLAVQDLSRVATVVMYMCAILPFMSIVQVLSCAYCARRDTHTLTKVGALVYTAAIPVRILSFVLGGINGIVVCMGVTGAVHCLLLKRYLKGKEPTFNQEITRPVMESEALMAVGDDNGV